MHKVCCVSCSVCKLAKNQAGSGERVAGRVDWEDPKIARPKKKKRKKNEREKKKLTTTAAKK